MNPSRVGLFTDQLQTVNSLSTEFKKREYLLLIVYSKQAYCLPLESPSRCLQSCERMWPVTSSYNSTGIIGGKVGLSIGALSTYNCPRSYRDLIFTICSKRTIYIIIQYQNSNTSNYSYIKFIVILLRVFKNKYSKVSSV